MRFRPEDQYCKPSIARSNKTSNLLLKVKRKCRKSKIEAGGGDGASEKRDEGDGEAMEMESGEAGKKTIKDEGNGGQKEYEYSMELVGIVNTTYQFSGNCLHGR